MASRGLQAETRELLNEPMLGEKNLDAKVRRLLEAEYLRRLGRYRHLQKTLAQKYGVTFDEFVKRGVTRQKEFAWDVEKDAMDWESAVSGAKTIERKLKQLREFTRV